MLSHERQVDQAHQPPGAPSVDSAAPGRPSQRSRLRRPHPDDPAPTPAPDLASGAVARLNAETVRIHEEERRKLSFELHDDIAQILGNLVLMMDACLAIAPADALQLHRYLDDARETAKEGFRRVQRFTLDLRPPMLDDLGLAPTIVWYAERFTAESGTPVAVAIPDPLPPLSAEQETALFRIVQSALHNVQRHAQACRVSITLEPRPGQLYLAIVDDGVGFDLPEVERRVAAGIHLGLAAMRYRAALLRGTLRVASAASQGTTIVVEIPVSGDGGPRWREQSDCS